MIGLRAITPEDLPNILEWRKGLEHTLRTPFPLTETQQQDWYHDTVCYRQSNARYWMAAAIPDMVCTIGMCGIENIEWENGRGEISLLIAPNFRGEGHGQDVLARLLWEGFGALRLPTIWGECYECSPALAFWERMVAKYKAHAVELPRMKLYQGKLWPALRFTFWEEACAGLL